jgi:hypothetical protein
MQMTDGSERVRTRRRLAVVLLGVSGALWVFAALALLGGLWSAVNTMEDACGYGVDDTGAGQSSWSWFPPGEVCTYADGQLGVHVDAPSVYGLTTALLLVAVPLAAFGGRAFARSSVERGTATAGWFPDPRGDATWRYWDGTDWTSQTA